MNGRAWGMLGGAVALVVVILLMFSTCGGGAGLEQFVAADCTTTPAHIVAARRTLRNQGLSRCADEVDCDDAYVMTQLAGANGCPAVTLAGDEPLSGVDTITGGRTVLHLFLESSLSMEGYFAQEKGLVDHLGRAIQQLHSPIGPATDSMSIYYAAKDTARYTGADRLQFVTTLIEHKIPNSIGRGSSDLADLIEMALSKTSQTEVSVLVSDMIFSPDGKNAAQYLSQQQTNIREVVERRLSSSPNDFSIAVVAAKSYFNGVYYNRNNDTFNFTGPRPYYCLIAGPRSLVLDVTMRIQSDSGGTTAFWSPGTLDIPISIEPNTERQRGKFSIGTTTNGVPTITDANPAVSARGEDYLIITLNADLSGLAEIETAVRNAKIKGGLFEFVEVVPMRDAEPPYTHKITLRRRGQQYPGTITLSLPRAGAGDLSKLYLPDDIAGPATFTGTFGLQQLVEGIEGAYQRDADQPAAQITFTVQ